MGGGRALILLANRLDLASEDAVRVARGRLLMFQTDPVGRLSRSAAQVQRLSATWVLHLSARRHVEHFLMLRRRELRWLDRQFVALVRLQARVQTSLDAHRLRLHLAL